MKPETPIGGDLDGYLKNLKKVNLIKTTRPYKGNLVQQTKQATTQLRKVIQIADEMEPEVQYVRETNDELFRNMVVLFPCLSISLSKKRVEILSNLIVKQHGIAYCTGYFCKETFLQGLNQRRSLIVITKDIQEKNAGQTLWLLELSIQDLRHIIVTPEWVTQSLASNKLLPLDSFRIFALTQNKQQEIVIEEQTFVQKSAISEPMKEEFSQVPSNNNQKPEIKDEIEHENQWEDLDAEYDRNLRPFGVDEKAHERRLRRLSSAAKSLMKQYSWMLAYDYDPNLEELNLTSEEEEEELENDIEDDCLLLNTTDNVSSLLEGINIPELIDIDEPLKSSNARDITPGKTPGLRKRQQFWDSRKDRFVCASATVRVNQNQHLTEHLERLLKCYSNDRDRGRTIAYKRAITFLSALPYKVKRIEDIQDCRTIGEKIKRKILEIMQTGSLSKADNLQSQPKNRVQELFSSIWGIGPQTALMLYFKGMRTLEDLQQNTHLLNKNQLIGLKYVHEFKQRIPRDECTEIVDRVKKCIERLGEDAYEAIACGSYRRGKPDCGDIDILITRKDGKNTNQFLPQVIIELEKGLLKEHLVLPRVTSNGSQSYMGVCQLKKELPHRRIDMKYYPREQFGFAVLYFTGSDHFNRSMRLYAGKKGFTLSDHGLFPVLRALKNQKVWKGDLIPCLTEEEVFQKLNLPYKRPEERNI